MKKGGGKGVAVVDCKSAARFDADRRRKALRGIVKLIEYRPTLARLGEAKPLEMRVTAIGESPRFCNKSDSRDNARK